MCWNIPPQPPLSLAPCCPKPVSLAGMSPWSPVALSPSWSRTGQWDGVATSIPGPSFPWDHFPEEIRTCGRSTAWLTPFQGSGRDVEQGAPREQEQPPGSRERGGGPWDASPGWRGADPFPACRNPTGVPQITEVPRQRSRACQCI